MFILFSSKRASQHLTEQTGTYSFQRSPVPLPVVAGTSSARKLLERADELRQHATGTAADLVGAQDQANEIGAGAWCFDTDDGSVTWIPSNRNKAVDKTRADEEVMWGNARPHRDGWKRRNLG